MTASGAVPAEPRRLQRYRPLVDDWPAFLEALARPLPVCVWANPSRIGADDLEAILREEGLEPRRLPWRPGAFRLRDGATVGRRWWFLAGLAHAQEEASHLPVALLDARPGHRVLDLCAAPGGKTAQIALALGNRGTLVANDVSASRLRGLRATLDRLGVVNVSVTRRDGCSYPGAGGSFDRVLVDAPCSGEGTWRRRSQPAREADGLPSAWLRRQAALLRRAAQLCRPGGRVVYATCTFAPEENEAIVDTVLREAPAGWLRVLPVAAPGLATGGGVTAWAGRELLAELRHAVRLWPHHNDTGGFFVTVLRRSDAPGGSAGAPPRDTAQLEDDACRADGESAGAAAGEHATPPSEWLPHTGGRFGIPERIFADYRVLRRARRHLQVAHRGHHPPATPKTEGIGLRFLRDGVRYPKITTAAALLLARHASRNVVDLASSQVQAFLERGRFPLEAGQDAACTDTGYVLVRHRGFGLGTGFYNQEGRMLQGLFPKAWYSTDAEG